MPKRSDASGGNKKAKKEPSEAPKTKPPIIKKPKSTKNQDEIKKKVIRNWFTTKKNTDAEDKGAEDKAEGIKE